MRAVLDTNVLVAALRSPTGASRKLLRMLAAEQYEAVASVTMFLEYEAVLKRPDQLAAFRLSAQEIDLFLDGLAGMVIPITPFFLWRPMLRDPADEHVLEAAVNGQADLIITFNLKDFRPAHGQFGIEMLRPRDALVRIKNG